MRQYFLANKLSHLFDGRATQRFVYILVSKSLYSFEKESKKRGFKKDADVTLKGGVYSTGYYSHRDYKHFKLGIKYVEQMEETWAFK